MHPERDVSDMKETCGTHSGYMRHTCILRGCQDTCWIHVGYMRDACEIHTGNRIRISRVNGNVCIDAIMGIIIVCAAHLSGHPFAPCVVVGLLQHPAAPPSSALSWPPRRRTGEGGGGEGDGDRATAKRTTQASQEAEGRQGSCCGCCGT